MTLLNGLFSRRHIALNRIRKSACLPVYRECASSVDDNGKPRGAQTP